MSCRILVFAAETKQRLRAPSFRLFSVERVGDHEPRPFLSSTAGRQHRCETKLGPVQILPPPSPNHYADSMYEDFHVADRWTAEDLHCTWKANIVAIATRHADAVDVRFDVNGRPMWIALPAVAWVAQKERSGKVITDQLTAQIAGRYLKQLVEEGYDTQREVYTMTVDEVLSHLDAVVTEAKAQGSMPSLPVGIDAAG
jgi:hypothetical protein